MRLPKHLIIALSIAALFALVAAGCGGGGDATTDTTAATTEATEQLTKAELISQGDAICAEVNSAVGSVGSSAADTQSQIEQVSNLYTGLVASLNDLGTPQEGAAEYAEFSAAAEELAKVEGESKLAAEREDSVALGEAATKAAPALENFEAQAAIYGFEECSEGPSAPTSVPSTAGESGEVEEEGGVEAAPEIEEVAPEEVAPEEIEPETGGAGGGIEEVAPEEAAPETGGSSGGVGPG
jgi:hypothetical protein